MRRKTISVYRIMDFQRCQRAYRHDVLTARDRKATESEVVGHATHRLTAGEAPVQTREFVAEKLPEAPEERREAVMEEAMHRSENAQNMSAPQVDNTVREVQLMWHDDETGYDVYAKPDELFFFDEVGRDRYGRKRVNSVMQITDVKSLAEEVRPYHWRQLFLFGLVATMALKYYHSIKLVVRLAGPEVEEYRWYSQKETYRQLMDLRATLRAVDNAWATWTFTERAGGYCKDCPLLKECATGQWYLGQRSSDDENVSNPLRVLPATATQACA